METITVRIKTFEEITANHRVVLAGYDHLDNFSYDHDDSKVSYDEAFEEDLPEDRVIELLPYGDHFVCTLEGETYYVDDYQIDDNFTTEETE